MSPVIDESIVLDAEYSEDKWKLKNRVIYVGADGKILADVSEGAGDLPVVVHDPYLTDPKEAERRANIRLALNKEYGRSLRITIHQKDFKDLEVDLGDICAINLPSIGLNGVDMVLLGIEYDPRSLRYRLEFGGRKELLEDWLDEQIGGDVARRFGKAMTLPEQTSTLAYSLDKIARIQADQKHVIYVNKPPLTLYNAENVILNSNGEVELASGAIEGSFEAQVLPPSELFVNWIKSEWIAWKKRYALVFKRNAYVEVPHDDSLNPDYVSVLAWVKIPPTAYTTEAHHVVRKEKQYAFGFSSDWKISGWVHVGGSWSGTWDGGGSPLNDGKWHLVGYIYDGDMIHFYVDGVKIWSYDAANGTLDKTTNRFNVGGYVEGSKEWFEGMMSAVYLYNRILSDAEINQIKENPWSPPRDGLVLRLNFDEGSGSTAYDKSGYDNHGTIYNAEWVELPINISAEFLNDDDEILGQVYDAYDTQFYRFRKWPQGYGSFTYRNSGNWGSSGASASDKRMGILHAYCLKLTPDSLGSDGEIYYPSSRDLSLDLSWAKWLRLYLYADHESDVTIKIRLYQDVDNYFEGSLVVKAKEWRKYEVSMDSLSQVGSPSLGQINWISIISPYPILIDSDHVFLPATRELMRVRFTLKRDSPDDPSPKIRLVKVIWREGA